MDAEKTNAEKLYDRLAEVAAEAGFFLDEIRLSARPRPGPLPPFIQIRVRSRAEMDRLPSPATIAALAGD